MNYIQTIILNPNIWNNKLSLNLFPNSCNFEIKGPADFLSFESTRDINPYPKSRETEALSETSSLSIFPIFSSLSNPPFPH